MSQARLETGSGQVVADQVVVARAPLARALGLLPRSSIAAGEAMVFPRCRSIHTWGMRFAIDVVFLLGEEVVKAVPCLGAWKLASAGGADTVVELPEGAIERYGLRPGARLILWERV